MMVTKETNNHVMHAEMIIRGTCVNMCDVTETVYPNNMFLFNVFFDSIDEVASAFHQFKEGGKVLTELGGSILDAYVW